MIFAGIATTDALAWLLAHGSLVDHTIGLQVVTLPDGAKIAPGLASGCYTVSFEDEQGELEDSYVVVDLAINAYDTQVSLRR